MKAPKLEHWSWVLRLLLAVLFLYAGGIKAFDPAGFLNDIEAYRLTHYTLSVLIAYYLPWLEIFAALALFFQRWVVAAATLLTGLMITFIGLLLSAWARGLDLECGCFGQTFRSADYLLLLLRDGVILGLAASTLYFAKRQKALLTRP